MAISLLRSYQEIFPLSLLFASYNQPDLELVLAKHQPVLILSQIEELEREIVERLEMAGIYDTRDFFDAHPQISDYLGIGEVRYAYLVNKIKNIMISLYKFPRLILDFPKNYAFISIFANDRNNYLGVLWSGIFNCWSDTKDEGWHRIKFAFDEQYELMRRPELIGVIKQNNNPPTWLNRVTDISIYYNNIDTDLPLNYQLSNLGIVLPDLSGEYSMIKKSVFSLAYLVFFSKKIEETLASR